MKGDIFSLFCNMMLSKSEAKSELTNLLFISHSCFNSFLSLLFSLRIDLTSLIIHLSLMTDESGVLGCNGFSNFLFIFP